MASFPEIPSAGSWAKPSSRDDVQPTGAGPEPREPSIQPSTGAYGEEWGTPGASAASTIRTTKAPEGILYVALGVAVLGLALSALFESVVAAAVSWVLAAPVGLGAATVFITRNAKRQTSPWYLFSPRPLILYRASVVVCIVAVVAASIRIALFVGRM